MGREPCRRATNVKAVHRIAIMVLLPLIACDDPAGPDDFVGTYTLVSIRGRNVPFVDIETGSFKQEILGGDLRILANGQFFQAIKHRVTNNGVVGVQDSVAWPGTWTPINRTELDLRSEALFSNWNVSVVARLDGRTLRYTASPTDTIVFRR